MLDELNHGKRVVGSKQLRRALSRGTLRRVFLARDADPALTEPLAALCAERAVPVEWVAAMRELGRSCGIAVGASAAGILSSME